MKKGLSLLAIVISVAAIVLAIDPGHFAFTYVDAGEHELRMLVSGHGIPAVVFESGGTAAAGGPLEAWEKVQPSVSKFTTTVSYDRAGIGLSAPGPKPRDARQVARELHAALHNARVAPPYVLVGHSFGGPFIRVFAGMYPDEVAGMLLIDPTQEEFLTWNDAHDPNHPQRHDEEWKDILAALEQAHGSVVPAKIPVVLITAMKMRFPPDYTDKQKEEVRVQRTTWLRFHQEWVDKIPNGRHIVTQNSGHVVPFEQPELIIRTLQQMIEGINKTQRADSGPGH